MTRRRKIVLLTTAIACAGLALGAARARDVPKVATGFIAHTLCSETFVSGLDPMRDLNETIDAMPGTGLLSWAMNLQIDRTRKDVTVSLFGIGRSHAVYREGLGCSLEHGRGSPTSRCRRMTSSPPYCPTLPVRDSCRRKARGCPPRSTVPSPSPRSRLIAARARSSS